MHFGKAKLSIRVLALTKASVLSLLFLILGILSLFGIGTPIVELLGTVFLGVDTTIEGVIMGACWGFVVGGAIGAVFAWLYNKML